jgi:hypothetical protein
LTWALGKTDGSRLRKDEPPRSRARSKLACRYLERRAISQSEARSRGIKPDFRIKVPHTGPVNAQNAGQLLEGDKRLGTRYNKGSTADYLYGHNLALKLCPLN